MPNITHAKSRPSSPKSKLLIVRQPVKSVHHREHPDRTPLRLAIGVVVALGVIGAVWLMGHLGYRLGFAPLLRAPDLLGEPGGGLATGTLLVISVPRVVFQAGLAQPLWLMLGFAMIAIPAAALGAANPHVPGGPRPKQSIALMSSIGAVASIISGILLLWWTGSPLRLDLVRSLPINAADAEAWHRDLQIAAGLDALAVITASLWMVLVLRLAIPRWLRAIAASAAFFTLVVVTVAMSITGAASAQIGQPRSVCATNDDPAAMCIILGTTPQHTATLLARDGMALIEFQNHPAPVIIAGRSSIVDYLVLRAADEADTGE